MKRFRKRLSTGLVAVAALACGREAQAQSGPSYNYVQPFPGTVRSELIAQQAQTGGQLYGAVGMLEHEILPRVKREGLVGISGFNMLMGGLSVPGYCSVCGDVGNPASQYRMFPVDTYAWSVGFGVSIKRFGFFGVASATTTGVNQGGADSFLKRGFVPMISAVTLPIAHLGLVSAPFLTGPTQVAGGRSTADLVSYVIGGSVEAYGNTAYLGLIGNGQGGGLYTNITQNKLRLLVAAALPDGLKQLSYVKAGLDRLSDASLKDLDKAFDDDTPPEPTKQDTWDNEPSATSFYGRKVQFMIPRPGAADVAYDVGRLSFWSLHAERTNIIGSWVDVGLAAGIAPELLVHEARLGLHTPGYHTMGTGLLISGGAVRLPALYMLAQQPATHFAFRVEGRILSIVRLSVYRNEPEILTAFPYAYDTWSVSFFMDVTRLLFPNLRNL